MEQGQSPCSWRTGTCAASWALRRAGKYGEADCLLLEKAKLNDAEALMELYTLHYKGSAAERFHDASMGEVHGEFYAVNKLLYLRRAATAAGHPVARARMHAQCDPNGDEFDWAQMEQLEFLCPPAVLLRLTRHELPSVRAGALQLLDEVAYADAWNSLRQDLIHVDHHPVVAYDMGMEMLRSSPELSYYLANSAKLLFYLGIAADQGHVFANRDIAALCFSYDLPLHDLNWSRGARALVRALAVEPHEYSAISLVAQRLTLSQRKGGRDAQFWRPERSAFSLVTSHRVRELYVYGRSSDTVLSYLDMSRENLTPRFVYRFVTKKARQAAVTIMQCMRATPLLRQPPRDIVLLLAQLIWDSRLSYTDKWWNMPTTSADWKDMRQ